MIQTNRSLTYEIQGDGDMAYADRKAAELALVEEAIAARDAGLPYDEEVLDPYGDGTEPDPAELRQDVQDWYEYAEQEYATAEQIRGWPDCGESEQTPEQQEQDAAAQQRLQDKQQEAQDAQPENQDGGDTSEGEGDGSEGDEQSDASGGDGAQGEDQQRSRRARSSSSSRAPRRATSRSVSSRSTATSTGTSRAPAATRATAAGAAPRTGDPRLSCSRAAVARRPLRRPPALHAGRWSRTRRRGAQPARRRPGPEDAPDARPYPRRP